MNVWMLRQRSGIDLHDWPVHYEIPIGTLCCYLFEQIAVEALVDNSKEPQTRMGNRCLIFGIPNRAPCSAKMLRINAAGERIDRWMLIALRFIQTLPASENEVHVLEKFVLERR